MCENMIKRQDSSKKKHRSWWNLSDTLFFLGVLTLIIIQFLFFRPVKVSGVSMMPTLEDEDLVTTSYVGDVERFDIVTFLPQGVEDHYIKRVVGLPGETIYYQNDQLFINGQLVEEPYLTSSKAELRAGESLTADFHYGDAERLYVIPANHYFVLGDNRQHSTDSRKIGPVERDKTFRIMNYRLLPFEKLGVVD